MRNDHVDSGWEQREIDIDFVQDALDSYLREPGDELSSPHDLVADLSASDLLDVLHRAGLLRIPAPAGAASKRTRPLVSDETIAEAAAMAERDRAAGGPPWEVPDHPDSFQPGGWHHGQITGTPAPDWER